MHQAASATRYSVLARRDAVCDEFEVAWRDGQRPAIEAYAARIPACAEQPSLVRELLQIELHYRRAAGESPRPEEYGSRLPQFAALLSRDWSSAVPSDGPDFTGQCKGSSAADIRFAKASPSEALPTWIGKYKVLACLGSGGQADVYRAVHPDLGLEVAIKWNRRQLPRMADWGPQREGKVLAELNHPGLAKVYDLDVCDGRPFLVLEYLPGVNLQEYAREHPVSVRRACQIVADLAQAAAFAHARGVVHHDIKPGNVLVLRDGSVRLIDFGLARVRLAWQTDEHDGRVAGTAAYMAPEQARGEPADQRADVFALGAVFYFLLTGQGPFEAKTSDAALARAVSGLYDRTALERSGASRRLVRTVNRALEPDPSRRYVSAHELEVAIETDHRRPQLVGLLSVVMLVAAFVAVVYFSRTPNPGSPTRSGPPAVASEPPWTPLGKESGLGQNICDDFSLSDLAIMMAFDSAYVMRSGNRTVIRDLSGQGRHGEAIDISLAPAGKFGNALAMGRGGVEVPAALLDHRAEYTLSCWLYYVPQPLGGVFYSEFLTQDWDRGDICMFSVKEDRSLQVAAWNTGHPQRWVRCATPPNVVPIRQWCFVAVTLRNGGVDQGELTVQIDDQQFHLRSQQISSNPPQFPARTSVVGANSALDRGFPGKLDHLWVFTRALSQAEIDLLRQTGRPAVREAGGP